MKIIVVLVADLLKTPPALSVIKALDDLMFEVVVCTIGNENANYYNNLGHVNNVKFEFINDSYKDELNVINKFTRMRKIRKKLWTSIDKHYDDDTLLWVISEVSVKHLGKELLNRKYLIHFLELIEDMYYISGNAILKMDREAYVGNAKAIIECEYNRAHITKAWWNLKEMPFVLPNKPYVSIDIPKNAEITSSEDLKKMMDGLKDKKIVLYQGNISKERPLDGYIKAVDELGEDWAFVMMLNGKNPYPELNPSNLYFIPFVAPPFHLEVTSRAYIGVLSYVPIKNSYSILNTLYCAPNKIWEYSRFGVPMISNDLPALRYLFDTRKSGRCAQSMNKDDIKQALLEIDQHYSLYSKASFDFYASLDYKAVVHAIVKAAFSA